jgi:caffeoyl-CoA O-methyltransferase
MEFIDPKLEEYIQAHTQPEAENLHNLNRDTNLKVLMPRMLSGHVQGRILASMSHMIQPEYVLEIGTYTGYSALCFAEGMTAGGRLITIDNNEELKTMHEEFIRSSDYADIIDIRYGKAMDIIPELDDGIDIVFIDADKENYSNYFDLVIDKVKTGGFILADNVLWSGKVIQEVKENDHDTKGIMAFNDKVHEDPRVENSLFPVRDGIMVLRKL